MATMNQELLNFYEQLIVRSRAGIILGMVGIMAKIDYSESPDGFMAHHVIVWSENIKSPGKKFNLTHTVLPTRLQAAEAAMRKVSEMYYRAEGVFHLEKEPGSASRPNVEHGSEIDTVDQEVKPDPDPQAER